MDTRERERDRGGYESEKNGGARASYTGPTRAYCVDKIGVRCVL